MKLKTVMTLPWDGSSVTAYMEYSISSDLSEIKSLDVVKWDSEDPNLTEFDKDLWFAFEDALDDHLMERGELI